MGRPRTIHVDPYAVLARIIELYDSEAQRLTRAIKDGNRSNHRDPAEGRLLSVLHYAKRDLKEYGLKYDLEAFAGRELTASEAIRHQQAIRELERQRLVQILGLRARLIRPTKKGRAKVKEAANATA